MNTARINNEISLTYPESFTEMGEEELKKYFGSPDNSWGVYDAGRHIALSVGWSKIGFFKSFSDAESQLISIESRLSRRLLNYQKLNSYKIKVAGKKARGIRFEYRVNDSVMVHIADVVVFKYKKHFYAVRYLTRKMNASANLPEFREALSSITAG